jgi:hypothetical protein
VEEQIGDCFRLSSVRKCLPDVRLVHTAAVRSEISNRPRDSAALESPGIQPAGRDEIRGLSELISGNKP